MNHLQWKKRKEQETAAAILWHNGQQIPPGYQDPVLNPSIKVVRSRSVSLPKINSILPVLSIRLILL